MPVLVGVAGATRNACAAVCVDGDIRAACEQERVTRVRGVGFHPHALPAEAVDTVLAIAGRNRQDVSAFVVAERQIQLPESLPRLEVDHHEAHAATAFLTSGFPEAAVLVCDTHDGRDVSVWRGSGTHLTDRGWPWRGCGLARIYSECAGILGFGRRGEHQLEAVARLGRGDGADRLRPMFRYVDGSLQVDSGWRAHLHDLVQRTRGADGSVAEAASAVQRVLGEVLLEIVADIRSTLGLTAVCLGGGLFFNTYFTTLVRKSGIFEDVFVPINPGNAGLAVGATMLLAGANAQTGAPTVVSPFMGPEYDSEAIKATLDGCKLSYAFVSESEAIDAAVDALTRGQLVGWFQGRMEWGHRALGHRSILADPHSPYVLDNLNVFLRKRERWRAFGLSVCEDTVSASFCGPPASSYMEYEYGVRDDRLRHVTAKGAASVRVQTVGRSVGPFWTLHKRMEQATGSGVLVNTSFNGFHEPIACSPRDAVRVFYGTGLDMLVIGRFILRK